VQAPQLTPLDTTSLEAVWLAPQLPNGAIESYILEMRAVQTPPLDFVTLAAGASPGQAVAEGLQPWRAYEFRLAVTNGAGTAFSGVITGRPCSAPPSGLSVAAVNVSSASAVLQVGAASPNGPNVRFALEVGAVSAGGADASGAVRASDVDAANGFQLSLLSPYTLYEARLTVCVNDTCAAGTQAEPAAALCMEREVTFRTDVGIPKGLQTPEVLVLSSSRVLVQWAPPTQPNAPVLEYSLYRDSRLVFSGDSTSAEDTGLVAGQPYVYTLAVSSTAGVTFAPEGVTVATQALAPSGLGAPSVDISASETGETLLAQICWQAPAVRADEVMGYTVLAQEAVMGVPSGSRAEDVGLVTCATLRQITPDVSLSIRVRACSMQGCVTSNPTTLPTPCVTPAPLTPSLVGVPSANALTIGWDSNVAGTCRGNHLTLEFRPADASAQATVSLALPLDSDTQMVRGLEAATDYLFQIRTVSAAGESVGGSLLVETSPLPPSGVPAPTLFVLSATELRASWTPPSQPNGVITAYRVLLGADRALIAELSGTEQQYRLEGLIPYNTVSVTVAACTAGGCSPGPSAQVRTLQALATGLATPVATEVRARDLTISWGPPAQPNGPIAGYTIEVERCLLPLQDTEGNLPTAEECFPEPGSGEATSAARGTLTVASGVFSAVFNGAVVRPYTLHRVRVGAQNGAGTSFGPWSASFAEACSSGSSCPNGFLTSPLRTAAVAPEVIASVVCEVCADHFPVENVYFASHTLNNVAKHSCLFHAFVLQCHGCRHDADVVATSHCPLPLISPLPLLSRTQADPPSPPSRLRLSPSRR
jgi:usherin